jgi:hypothetical protein
MLVQQYMAAVAELDIDRREPGHVVVEENDANGEFGGCEACREIAVARPIAWRIPVRAGRHPPDVERYHTDRLEGAGKRSRQASSPMRASYRNNTAGSAAWPTA